MSDTNTSVVDVTAGANDKTEAELSEHEQKMVKLIDENNGENVVADKILGKFNSQEDLEAAYKNLESEMGKLRNQDSPTNTTDNADTNTDNNNNDDTKTDNDISIKKEDVSSKVDMEAVSKEFQEKGVLSEDTLKNLESIGLDQKVMDIFFKGLEAQETLSTNEVYDYVGGKESFDTLSAWVSANLTAAEIDAYTTAQESGNMDMVKMHLNGFRDKFEAVNGTGFKQTDASSSNGGESIDVFNSASEVVSAISDPRYSRDPAYRNSVEQKIGRSKVL